MTDQQKGFAELSGQVSGIDNLIQVAKAEAKANEAIAANAPAGVSEPRQTQSSSTKQEIPIDRDRKIPWALIVVGGIIALIIYGASSSDNKNKPVQSQSTNSAKLGTATAFEEVPPIGTDLVLNEAQITYCLAEHIRLDGAKSNLISTNNAQIDRFNRMIDDFNLRCSKYRYRTAEMDRARSSTEANLSVLFSEGMKRFR